VTNFILAKKGSRPLINLSELTREISLAEAITVEHLSRLKTIKPAEMAEIRELQHSFIKMTNALFLKNLENTSNLAKLLIEKDKLDALTQELHAANLELEKRVEERTANLNNAMLELRELNRMKTKFLANMSHEIRTPLNSIIGFSDLLHEECIGDLNDKQKEYIQIILKSAELLLELINDILDMSMIDQGKITINKQLANPNQLIDSAVTIVQALADRKQLNITKDLSNAIPNIFVDPLRIKQVLYNIINNAIKFTPAGGSIVIQSKLTAEHVVISVADNGIGIKQELLSKVFDEFFQAEKPHEKVYDGVGLGLPLSKKLIEMHDGKIELFSACQKGTTVVMYLPAHCLQADTFDIRLHLID
jgi:signal transduction histidine kinase